jgi:hypothetical protein
MTLDGRSPLLAKSVLDPGSPPGATDPRIVDGESSIETNLRRAVARRDHLRIRID